MLASFFDLANPGLIILLVIVGTIAVPVAFQLDWRLHVHQSDARPFKWGYWTGMSCFLVPLLGVANAGDRDAAGVFLLLGAIYGPVGILVLLRQRWALVAATVLSFNPFLWFINGFYIHNRWAEMATTDKDPPPIPPSLPPPPIPSPATTFFLQIANQVEGPFTMDELGARREAGTISSDTMCCASGTEEWFPAERIFVWKTPGT